jgi:hypothetical protein
VKAMGFMIAIEAATVAFSKAPGNRGQVYIGDILVLCVPPNHGVIICIFYSSISDWPPSLKVDALASLRS